MTRDEILLAFLAAWDADKDDEVTKYLDLALTQGIINPPPARHAYHRAYLLSNMLPQARRAYTNAKAREVREAKKGAGAAGG